MLNNFCWEIVHQNGFKTFINTKLNRFTVYPHQFRKEFNNHLEDLYEKGYRKYRRTDLGNIAAIWYKIVKKDEGYGLMVDRD